MTRTKTEITRMNSQSPASSRESAGSCAVNTSTGFVARAERPIRSIPGRETQLCCRHRRSAVNLRVNGDELRVHGGPSKMTEAAVPKAVDREAPKRLDCLLPTLVLAKYWCVHAGQ
jgi:hypothetical protein